jgi:hypothetical protein
MITLRTIRKLAADCNAGIEDDLDGAAIRATANPGRRWNPGSTS